MTRVAKFSTEVKVQLLIENAEAQFQIHFR